jgi:drug/metabolite transporter (DMT)-like permease
MALLSGSLAYFLYQKAQKTIEASEATLFSYLSPLFAIPLAVFWLKEEITIFYLLGAVIVAIGVIIAESKRRKK